MHEMAEPETPKEPQPEAPASVEDRLKRIEVMVQQILSMLGARAATGLGH